MRKHLISRKVLQTELSMIIQYIERMDFGTAAMVLRAVLERVEEYDLEKPVATTNSDTD